MILAKNLELEELPEAELVSARGGSTVGYLADQDVGAQLLHLVVEHLVYGGPWGQAVPRVVCCTIPGAR